MYSFILFLEQMATEEEKAALRQKLEKIEVLTKVLEDLTVEKKKIQQDCEPAHSLVKQGMEEFRTQRIELAEGGCIVQKVNIMHPRKPTMHFIYSAIQNVLGEQAESEIKSEV